MRDRLVTVGGSGAGMGDAVVGRGSPAAPGATTPGLPVRYAVRRTLKEGNGVATLLARDRQTGLDVVVKSIDPAFVPEAARLRFEHETAVLRHLSGTGLVGLHDAGRSDEKLYLVQPFVSGPGLAEVIARGPLPLEDVLRIGIDLAGALDVAHGAGVCHRDVKPANVVLDRAQHVERATLVDFGFARSPWLDQSIRDDLVGTLRYLAPESAGVLASPADERSDLYALGVVLFESLTGHPPFRGPSVGDLLRQHLSAPVPEVRELGVAVPRVVDVVLQRLLRKDPAERYQSASALAGDLSVVLTALQAGDLEPRLVVGRLDQRRTLTDPAFVGREAELDELTELVESLGDAGGGLVLLEAESGGGKSRLLSEVAQRAARAGVAVLHGQGVAQAGQRPFGLLHGVAHDLVSVLVEDPVARHAVVEDLGDSAAAVVRALPQLAAVLEVPVEDDTGPEQFGEQRSLIALARLVRALGRCPRPVLLVLDDCQWADALTVRLLDALYAEDVEIPIRVAVVAAFRSEEVQADHPLRAVAGGTRIALGPLSPGAVAVLAESMAGPLPAQALKAVVRLADGSPFMGAAVLRGLVETGALVGTVSGWVVDEQALQVVQTARRAAVVLVRRLELLDPSVLSLLSVGAVLGKQFDVGTAVGLAGTGAAAAGAFEIARRRRLLWVDERTGRCTFFHDKVREALLARLDDSARQQLHGRAAEALRATRTDDDVVFDLAYHFDAAGRPADALPYALDGAELARSRHALDTAGLHYRMAERAAAADGRVADRALRARIAEGLGDVLTLQGVYAEAEERLTEARDLVEDAVGTAALDGKLGDLAFKRGDVPTAQHHLEAALRQLGRSAPCAPVVVVLRLLWEVLVQAAHTVAPRLAGRRGPAPQEQVLAMRVYSRLAYVHWFGSGLTTCGWAHLRGLNLAERYAPSPELGQAWSEHAPVMTMIPWFSRGIRYAERSLAVRRELGDVWGQGQSLGFSGVVAYAASDYPASAEHCRAAIRLLERTGDQWEVNTARWNLALCLHRAGDLAEAADLARAVFADAQAIGDGAAAGIALSVWARSTGGDVDADLVRTLLDQGSRDVHRTSELHLALALHLRARGRLGEAEAELRAGLAAVRAAGLRQEYVAPPPCWHATVLRELAEATPVHDPALRRQRLRAAARAARRARRWAFSYRNNAPHALRESALVASLRGRRARALRLLARSIRVAEEQGARYERALSALALAELLQLGPAGVADPAAVESARAEVEAMEFREAAAPGDVRPTMSTSDRFSTLLDVGRTLAAATSAAVVETAVREAALLLLRGERCHLVRVGALHDGGLTTDSGESVDEVSRTLLAQAVARGGPVVASDLSADDSESLLLSGVRSVLAAPVLVDGEPVACFYVTHRLIGELFGPEEVQLAAFIATLAGAAYEHLAGTEARFRSLAQNSSDVITLVDREGLVEYQSAAAARVFGNSAVTVVGRRVEEWPHPDDVSRFRSALAQAARGSEVRIECRLRHNDGSYRLCETSISNLLDVPDLAALVLNTRDITERQVLEDELRLRALHDALTELPNRALFLDRARQALERSRRRSAPLVVAFLDLDDFKAVNDTFGHSAGDELLVEMARRLVSCVRPSDTVARLGGDEFALLLEDSDLDAARAVVERMLEVSAEPVVVAGNSLVVSVSIGLTQAQPGDSDPDLLLVQADTAMYAAKQRGKRCYDTFVPRMRTAMERRSRMRTELDRAVAGQQFRVLYQPIMDLTTGVRVGAEALVRWQHPERGLLAPADFIGFAEDSGQIVPIGAWVLATACCETAALGPGSRMSVNVSGRQLRHRSLVRDVEHALEVSGLPPARLILEITETATAGEGEAQTTDTVTTLLALKDMGVQVALDDFGTGFSPLSHLRRFPVDLLKIDRSFVAGMTDSPHDAAIVRGVVDLAHALGVRVVAEGVEEPEQLAALVGLGCDLGQGYLWMRPAALADLTGTRVPGPRIPEQGRPSVR